MIELLKLAIAQPLHAVVVTLCFVVTTLWGAVITLHVATATMNEAIAKIQVKQDLNEEINDRVLQIQLNTSAMAAELSGLQDYHRDSISNLAKVLHREIEIRHPGE